MFILPENRAWKLVRRIDLTRPTTFIAPERCERCGRALRYVDLLENDNGERLAVGRQCGRRLREGGGDASVA